MAPHAGGRASAHPVAVMNIVEDLAVVDWESLDVKTDPDSDKISEALAARNVALNSGGMSALASRVGVDRWKMTKISTLSGAVSWMLWLSFMRRSIKDLVVEVKRKGGRLRVIYIYIYIYIYPIPVRRDPHEDPNHWQR